MTAKNSIIKPSGDCCVYCCTPPPPVNAIVQLNLSRFIRLVVVFVFHTCCLGSCPNWMNLLCIFCGIILHCRLIVACILFFLTTHFSACILIDCRMISCDFQCHSCSIFSFGGYNISSWPRAIIRSLVDGLSDGSAKDSGTVNSANAAASCRRIRPGDGSVWRLAIPWRPPWFRTVTRW